MAPKKVKPRKPLARKQPKKNLVKLMDSVIASQQAARVRADWRKGMQAANERVRAWALDHVMRQPNVINPTVRPPDMVVT